MGMGSGRSQSSTPPKHPSSKHSPCHPKTATREAPGPSRMFMPVRNAVTHARLDLVNVTRTIGFLPNLCLLYTSDAADEEDSVDLGGRRIIKKKKTLGHL
eukprot:TRINITY_DN40510_c0_g1_i3.p1 TRINITY_DN40510_c0_g1~~TRINITY_DN40510_c0_g1_i3.p1  ORF type:complete len:100 (-),score=13.46 TRINITY_DN40510_c0_g1_i3:59-358(-)